MFKYLNIKNKIDMNNIKKIDEFITEKKVTIKRKYTERYPAKYASTSARVRNAVLNAIGDGVITEEEMDNILSEIQAHKRWKSRNSKLFNIVEEGGIRKVMLSPRGKKIKKLTIGSTLNEALSVPYKERGKKPVNIFVGRFQPFTLGHVKVFEQMYKKNGLPIVVFLVRSKKPDPKKTPFSEDIQQAMFAKMIKQYPFLEASYVISSAAIDTIFSTARPTYEPIIWGFGTDRKKSYEYMINKPDYREQLGVNPEFSGLEIKRNDNNISASKVRQAINNDDENTFKKMTPKSIHSFYKTLQTELQPIAEKNKYAMKNLKSLNEFTNKSNVN